MDDDAYAQIRTLLKEFIGERLVEVTQHDAEDFVPGGQSDVYLHFGNGQTLHFLIDDKGFEILGLPTYEEE
jgi:hypothetical protein